MLSEIGRIFSTDAPLRKVFFYMLLHLLRSTWHCTLQQSIALIRQHLHIFQYFITQMQTLLWFLEKVCIHHRSFSFYQILMRQYHNHLMHERREERLQTLLHSLMHNSIHNSTQHNNTTIYWYRNNQYIIINS